MKPMTWWTGRREHCENVSGWSGKVRQKLIRDMEMRNDQTGVEGGGRWRVKVLGRERIKQSESGRDQIWARWRWAGKILQSTQ